MNVLGNNVSITPKANGCDISLDYLNFRGSKYVFELFKREFFEVLINEIYEKIRNELYSMMIEELYLKIKQELREELGNEMRKMITIIEHEPFTEIGGSEKNEIIPRI